MLVVKLLFIISLREVSLKSLVILPRSCLLSFYSTEKLPFKETGLPSSVKPSMFII